MLRNKVFFLLLSVSLCSCVEKVYFTQQMRDSLGNSGIGLDEVQFYNDRHIVLKRVVPKDTAQIKSGRLSMGNEKMTELIHIKRYTPGICENEDGNLLKITFEEGDEKFIVFQSNKEGGYFRFSNTQRFVNLKDKVPYGDQQYVVEQGNNARLVVNKSQFNKLEIEKRILKGKKIAK